MLAYIGHTDVTQKNRKYRERKNKKSVILSEASIVFIIGEDFER